MKRYASHRGTRAARRLVVAMLSSIPLGLSGCGDQGPPGVELWGSITWKGKPIPTGYVVFNPDVKQGNSGHQGIAEIKNGHYDTRSPGGRRVALGRQVVSIAGFDSPPALCDEPRGHRLFLPYEQTIEPPTESGELDLVVPENVLPLPAEPSEEQ